MELGTRDCRNKLTCLQKSPLAFKPVSISLIPESRRHAADVHRPRRCPDVDRSADRGNGPGTRKVDREKIP